MEASGQILEDLRGAICEVAPEFALRLDSIEIYLGSNPFSDRPAIGCRIRTDAKSLSAPKVRKLLESRLDARLEHMSFATGVASSEKAAALVAAFAATLLTRNLHIRPDHGARSGSDGSADCWVEFLLGLPAGPMLKAALKTALVAVAAAIAGKSLTGDPIEKQLRQLQELCERNRPHKLSSYLLAAARTSDIPYVSMARTKMIWQFGWGNRGRAFLGAASNDDGHVGFNIAKFKNTAKQLFRELGIPTPRWRELLPGGDPAEAVALVGFPCVVKPADSSLGEGVTANIRTMAEYQAAVALARGEWDRKVLVEAHLPGDDHRLMVIDGQLFAAVRREPPAVIGDGVSTLRQLVDRMNASRRGTLEDVGFLSPVETNPALLLRLQGHGMGLDTVLPAGSNHPLLTVANRSAGGSAVDVTVRVHPQVRAWAEQLATTVGLRITGIDYVTPDIAADPRDVSGGFIEINATPGLQVLSAAGLDRIAIGRAVLGKEPGRIPVDFVLTERNRIDEIVSGLRRQPRHAMAWPTGMELDGSLVDSKGLNAFDIAATALRNRSVDCLTFVWACEDMTTYGLPVDRIRQTRIVGADPEARWRSLLKRISSEVIARDASMAASITESALA